MDPLCFLDFSRKDLKRLLQNLCRNQCYHKATRAARKDVKPSKGHYDHDLTLMKNDYWSTVCNNLPLSVHRQSALVGCIITNDRRARAYKDDYNTCRFCNQEVECMPHLASCERLLEKFPRGLNNFDLGPNFALTGSVEIPDEIVQHRFRS